MTLRYCCGVPAYNGPVNELSVLFIVTVKFLDVEVYIGPSRRESSLSVSYTVKFDGCSDF